MKRVALLLPFLVLGGCVIRARPAVVEVQAPVVAVQAPVVEVAAPEVVVEPVAPVIEGPGVEVVTAFPVYAQREYVYEAGFPPGVYLYGGFYYYGGHRYERGFFRDRFVRENLRNHRFEHVDRRAIDRQREFHRTNGGRPHTAGRPAEIHRH